jgi:hypothetical protein
MRRATTGRAIALMAALIAGLTIATPPATAATDHPGSGYWMLGIEGAVYTFGTAPDCGNALPALMNGDYAVDIEPFPDGTGYWVLQSRGYVDAVYCDDSFYTKGYENNGIFSDRLGPTEVGVSLSATPDGGGYWVFTNLGRVIPFGNAQNFGDMSSVALNGPVLGSVATPSGNGFWMVASDGGIFSFGDAQFYGSMGGRQLNQPVMSMAPDPDGRGYWLVASDGGIFAFDAPFYGSMGSTRLNRPIAGMVASPTGGGYLMVGADGGIFSFGDVPFHGSLGATPPFFPISAVAVMP